MNHSPLKGQQNSPSPAELLAKMPRRPMTPEQQAAALEKVQQQATQRVKLGQQLFEAADARLKQHQQVLEDINDQQQKLREQVQQDVAKSLQTYDQWMGRIDESFTGAIRELNSRLDQMELRVDASRGEMEAMIDKAAALLNQTQSLLAEVFDEDVIDEEAMIADAIDSDEDIVAAEMQQSIPEDQHCDVDALGKPSLHADHMDDDEYQDEDEVIEVDIVDVSRKRAMDHEMDDAMPSHENTSGDDVFGEVLRRLRSQSDDEDGNAAA